MHRKKFTQAMSCHGPSHLPTRMAACLWFALAFVPCAFSVQPNTREIIKLSIAAIETDWEAIPHFSDIERDIDTRGEVTTSKTYKVLMIDGSPYYRLIALNDQPLPPAEQARENEKLKRVIAKRSDESEKQRAKRLAQYQEDRNRMFAMMRAMEEAFDFKLAGEERLDDHDVYVLEATPRPDYQPKSRETKILTGMKGTLWIDRDNYQWVKVEAEVLRPVPFGWFIARVMPGTSFLLEQSLVGNGLWLPKHFRFEVKAKVLWLAKGFIHDESYRDYRQILPFSTPQ